MVRLPLDRYAALSAEAERQGRSLSDQAGVLIALAMEQARGR